MESFYLTKHYHLAPQKKKERTSIIYFSLPQRDNDNDEDCILNRFSSAFLTYSVISDEDTDTEHNHSGTSERKAHAEWKVVVSGDRRTVKDDHVFIDDRVVIWGKEKLEGNMPILPRGRHSFPFRFQLPESALAMQLRVSVVHRPLLREGHSGHSIRLAPARHEVLHRHPDPTDCMDEQYLKALKLCPSCALIIAEPVSWLSVNVQTVLVSIRTGVQSTGDIVVDTGLILEIMDISGQNVENKKTVRPPQKDGRENERMKGGERKLKKVGKYGPRNCEENALPPSLPWIKIAATPIQKLYIFLPSFRHQVAIVTGQDRAKQSVVVLY
ncbi:arrestin_N domain-containing protein [Caerostris extrusa]|uniref:Arrestin_N domain-containing protein n=1 Tax=Caerostris extrusa TaxID=172846 RepID=A0AAV4S1S5_CAEEX|nr:arrestin_N domain-containing protein [Caerostris extrusa]